MRLFRWLIPFLLLSAAFTTSAQEATEPPVLAVLASAPDTPNARQILSYADYAALTSGAATADAWVDSLQNLYSGPDLSYFHDRVDAQETLIGMPMFAVAQAATWGQPPEHTQLLQGVIDAEAVSAAYAARNYSANPSGALTMYCGPDGCDSGARVNVMLRNPGDPFGGELGRMQPVVFVPLEGQAQLISSPYLPALEASVATASGESPSLADSPDYQTAVRALTESSTLLQAYFVNGEAFGELADAAPLPAYSLAVLAETETDDGVTASITLIFPTQADAEAAVSILETRMETLSTGRSSETFAATLKDRGVLFETQTAEDAETGLGLLQFTFHAPEDERSAYGLLVNAWARRELGWLALA